MELLIFILLKNIKIFKRKQLCEQQLERMAAVFK